MKSTWKIALCLFLVTLLEFWSSGLLIPITMKSLAFNNHAAGMTLQDYLTGSALIIVLSPAYFITSPIIGHYSDQLGRKKVLLFCMLLSTIGYSVILSGYNLISIPLMLVGIMLFSIGSSSLSVILAAISDISVGSQRAYFYGLIMIAALMMLIAGQVSLDLLRRHATGVFQDVNPLWIAILSETLCLIIAVFFIPETKQIIGRKPRTSLPKFLLGIIDIFRNKLLRRLFLLFLLAEIAWGLNYQTEFNLLTHIFNLSPTHANHFLIYEGLFMMLGLATLYPLLIKRYKPIKLFGLAAGTFIASSIIWLLSAGTLAKWVLNLPLCLATAMLTPLLWLMIANTSKPKHCGLAMGIGGPAWSLGWTTSGLLGSSLANVDSRLPLLVASSIMLLVIVLARRCK